MCARAKLTSDHGPSCPGSIGTGILPLCQAWRVPPPQGAEQSPLGPFRTEPQPWPPRQPLETGLGPQHVSSSGKGGSWAAPVCSGPSQAGCQLQLVDSRPGPTCHWSPGFQAKEDRGMAFPVPGDPSSLVSPGSQGLLLGVVVVRLFRNLSSFLP